MIHQSEIDALERRGKKTVTVIDAEKYEAGFPPDGPVLGFLRWLEQVISDIPKECQQLARIEFDAIGGYEGSVYPHIEISYARPETDEEWAERKARVQRRIDEQQHSELAAYEALKAKFEPK